MKTKFTISKSARGMILVAFLLAFSWAGAIAQSCNASFSYKNYKGVVSFSNFSTGSKGLIYFWDFGDGSTENAKSPIHDYKFNGVYSTCLYIRDSSSTCDDTVCQTIMITDACNPISVTGTGKNPTSTSACNGSIKITSVKGGAAPYKYAWLPNVSNSLSASKLCGGTYNITVTDAKGCTGMTSIYIKGTSAQNCKAGYKVAVKGTTASFTNTSKGGGTNPHYSWNFGDGNYDNSKNPVHNFKYKGTYVVCLTIGDSTGDSTSKCFNTFCNKVVITDGCSFLSIDENLTNPSSPSSCDGAVKITSVTGGVTPYKYTWSPNVSHSSSASKLCGGAYNIIVTDAKGCTGMTNISIQAPNCKADFKFNVMGTAVAFTNTSKGGGTNPHYSWNFGDGNYDSMKNPVHNFKYKGTYMVCLTLADSIGDSTLSCYNTFCDKVVITTGCNLLSIVGKETNPSSPSACDGTISITSVIDGVAPYKYTWLPNVSSSSSASNLCGGRYDVTVTDAKGCTGMASYYMIPDTANSCAADFTYVVTGNSVAFTSTSTGANSLSSFRWDFGDGIFEDRTGRAYWGFMKKGFYPVSLLMYDSLGSLGICTDTKIKTVEITQDSSNTGGCSASVGLFQDSINSNPLFWYAYSNVTGTAPFTYLWNFGDGSTSTQEYPSHTYATAGHYVICLTITDATGCTSSSCDSTYKMAQRSLIKNLIVLQHATGIKENSFFVSSVFPNPASELLSISLDKVVQGVIQISDITGREVYQEKINTNNIRVNVSNFPAGYYNITIVSGDKASHNKVMIAR